MTVRTVLALSAGLSTPSTSTALATRLADHTAAMLAEHGLEATTTVAELRPHAHAIVDALLTGFPSGDLAGLLDHVTAADALIWVTPTFATSYSGLFKSFVDLLDPEQLTSRPVLLAATGGTARHSLMIDYALRPVFTYLHADVMTTGVYATTDDWAETGDTRGGGLAARVERAAAELASAVAARPPVTPTDPFANTPSFTELLGP